MGTPEFFPKLRLKSDDRRSQILAAALDVFAELGFHGARTRDLAEKAGVSEALLFRHFPTKEDLVRAILESVGFEERIAMMEEHFTKLSPREGLCRIAEYSLTALRDDPRVFRVIFFGVLEVPDLAGEFYRRFLSRLLALETRLFERAFAERGARRGAQEAAVAARSFHGSLFFYQMTGAIVRIEPLPKNPKERAEAIVNLYLPEEAA
ncbi:MAG TPA: helix-turn-helix domain-containing protein [Candidatus Binatia bacterium]|nr:helix-turn-helix domain-containing protein [Candidatus Binatia bacterium]